MAESKKTKSLDKLGYRGLFGSGLGAGLGPAFGTSLSANLTASLSANFGASLGNSFPTTTDRASTRDCIFSSATLSLDRSDRALPSSGVNGGSGPNTGRDNGGKESGLELAKPSLVYDIASLILYRCHALPIRLKIAMDRLFSVLTHEDVLQVLHGFGWTYEDYARGYMLQDQNGCVLHKWNMVTPEEEAILLQQFLRFGETKNIVQQLLHQDSAAARLDRVARDIREARDLRDSREKDTNRDLRDFRERENSDHRDHRELREHREHREYREHRDIREQREHRDHHRDHRDHRESNRDFREGREDHRRDELSKSFHHHPPPHPKHLSNHQHQQHSQPPFPLPLQFPDPNKPLDPEQLKKILERNMLFNPFMRGAGDPSSLLRPPHPANPHGIPPASPLSNLLAVNPSLASSLLANPQLASSLSMLRLPVPPVSLPNLSPNNGTLPASFGGPTSPMGGSPLNRLQSMQPFDFRKDRKSPSPAPRSTIADIPISHCGPRPTSATATSPNSITSAGSVGGTSPSSTVTPLGASAQPNADTGVSQERMEPLSEDDDSSSASSIALNLSTTTTTVSPAATPVGAGPGGPGPGGLGIPPKSTTPTGVGPPTPPKRSWNPINMGTSLINPVTGKKRVQCNVCLKTFCDKGALKIHFSAVHLREMHKCTVEGCNMMFSSRRSRNRHSANPNPKLHTPHVRRKISPHDGRTSGSHPVIMSHAFQQQLSQGLQPPPGFPPLGAFPGQFGGINPLTGLPFIPHGATSSADLHKHAFDLQRQNIEMQSMGKSTLELRANDESIWRYGPNSMSASSSYIDEGSSNNNTDHVSRKLNNFDNKIIDNNTYMIEDEDDSMSIDAHSLKGDGAASSPSANKRKRKNQNPTKFAFRLEDDDLISTDDDDDDDNDDDLDDIDAKDSEDDKNIDKELDAMTDVDDEEDPGQNVKSSSLILGMNDQVVKPDKESGKSNNTVTPTNNDEPVEISNALRHLEDLSKGNFNHLIGGQQSNGSLSANPSGPPGNGVSSSSPKPSEKDSEQDSDGDSHNEELENSLHYTEGGFLSNVDVPLDRENARRCVACGKMFQNHFGVKIHYQNVHLKLMHKCTVDGCNAAFPSKRSRDRHASNLNLHRKLLSTCSENFIGLPHLGFPNLPLNSPLNPELLARLYSDPASFSLEALKAQLPTSLADSLFCTDRAAFSSSNTTPVSTATTSPFFLHNLLPHLTSNSSLKTGERSRTPSPKSTTPISTSSSLPFTSINNSISATTANSDTAQNTISPKALQEADQQSAAVPVAVQDTPKLQNEDAEMAVEEPERWIYKLEDDLPSPDREGNMPCRFCYQTFEDGEGLKKHYEAAHMKELFKCSVEGCFKAFSSRRKRNSHELNNHSSTEGIYET